jgi:hypothetical protein
MAKTDSHVVSARVRTELRVFRERILEQVLAIMLTFVLWCVLFVLCWPLALAALVLYPLVWLVLLPFRIVGIAVQGVLDLVWAIVTLPARLLRHPRRA